MLERWKKCALTWDNWLGMKVASLGCKNRRWGGGGKNKELERRMEIMSWSVPAPPQSLYSIYSCIMSSSLGDFSTNKMSSVFLDPLRPAGARWHQGELSESLPTAQRYLTRQRGGWRRGETLQWRRLGNRHPGDPRETQGQPGGRRGHAEATQDGGTDQKRARRSVTEAQMFRFLQLVCSLCLFLSFFLSFISFAVPSPCLFLFCSALNPLIFRQEESLCLPRTQTDSFSCLGLLSATLCIFITTWQVRCAPGCMCSSVNVGRLKKC